MLLVYIPNLVPYAGYVTMEDEFPENSEYEPLCGEEQVFPERHASLFSST